MSIQYKNSDYKNFDNIFSNNEQKVSEKFSLKEEILKEKSSVQKRANSVGIRLYMFQTGTLKTKLKYIKMNQSNEDF